MRKKLFISLFFSSVMLFSTITVTAQTDIEPDEADKRMNVPKQVKVDLAQGEKTERTKRENENYRDGLAAYITSVNGSVSDEEAAEIVSSVIDSAEKYDVDEKLVMAIAHTESTYYPDAVSHADFKGIMQTSDLLAREAGYSADELFDPSVSIDIGTSYIDEKLDEFGDTRLALTAYNQGAGTVYSGRYSTGYADLAMARMEAMEAFLHENGYVNVYN